MASSQHRDNRSGSGVSSTRRKAASVVSVTTSNLHSDQSMTTPSLDHDLSTAVDGNSECSASYEDPKMHSYVEQLAQAQSEALSTSAGASHLRVSDLNLALLDRIARSDATNSAFDARNTVSRSLESGDAPWSPAGRRSGSTAAAVNNPSLPADRTSQRIGRSGPISRSAPKAAPAQNLLAHVGSWVSDYGQNMQATNVARGVHPPYPTVLVL